MYVDSLALVRQILRGIVGEHHVRLAHGREQHQEETPRFVEVYVGQTRAPETTAGAQHSPSARTEVQARLDRADVPYAVCGDIVLLVNDDVSWPLELVSGFSHKQRQAAQQVQGGDKDVWKGKKSSS